MKSLLLKDLFTLTRQLRIFLLLLLIFVLIPGLDLAAFAVVYAAFLPISAVAYDEQSKWDQLAVMMPYNPLQLVFSKYLLGYLACLAAALLSLAARFVYTAITGAAADPVAYLSIPVTAGVAVLLQAIGLPAIFRLGVEKGRFVFLALIVLVITMATRLPESASIPLPNGSVLVCAGIIILILINLVSIRLSMRFFLKKVRQ